MMTRKQKRLGVILGGLTIVALAAALILTALSDKIVFFHTPDDVIAKNIQSGIRFRLGGMVDKGSIVKNGTTVTFRVTDTLKTIPVTFTGQLPDLFREGQGVVADGTIDSSGVFVADTILAKHDENYMPKDLSDSLKAKGVQLGKGAGS